MLNLERWPSLIAATLGPLAVLLVWSVVGQFDGAATVVMFLLVALAVVASNG